MKHKRKETYYDIDAIVAERKKQGYTQKSFADKCGVSIATIQALEQGKYVASIDTVISVCKTLGMPTPTFDDTTGCIVKNSCHNCAWRTKEEWEMPCAKCRRKCKDYWRKSE